MRLIPTLTKHLKPLARLSRAVDQYRCAGIIAGTSLWLIFHFHPAGFAQSSLLPPTPATCDLNLAQLKSAELGKDRNIITADTASPNGSTVPSLWWTNEQFSTKLVTNWIANQKQKQIYLLVNAQSWNGLDYVDRYHTIDRFGRAAHDYGYNLKICNSQKVALADYTCDSGASDPVSLTSPASTITNHNNQNGCQIWLHTTGQSGMGIKAK
jgi:hypothetical protein